MLTEEGNLLLEGLNSREGSTSDHSYVTEMDHDLHELVLFSLGNTVLGELLDTVAYLVDELFDVLDLDLSVGDKMSGVLVNPSLASGQKLVNEVLCVDLEPSDVV